MSVVAGAVLGALPLYYLGRRWGEERVKRFADRHGRWLTVCGADLDKAKRWFDRHSVPPGLRACASSPLLAYTTGGALLWTAFLACTGYAIGAGFRNVGDYLDPVSWIVVGVILAIYIYRVAQHKGRR